MATAATTRRARKTPAPRLTVVSIPSLDPVRAEALGPFFDTVYGIAARLVREGESATSTAA